MRTRIAWSALLTLMVASALAQQANLVKQIVVHGNHRVTTSAILAAMTTKVGQVYTQANLDRDRQVLLDLGLFTSVDLRPTPLDSGANWLVTVDVDEQPTIKEIRVVGNTVVPTKDIVAKFTLKPGDVVDARQLRPIAQAVEKLYADRGYFAVVSDLRMLPESPGTLSMDLLETHVGTVAVQGTKLTKPWVMQHLIKTRTGEIWNETKWRNDLRRLLGTQWFESVDTQVDTERELGAIDLTAVVKEAKTGSFNVGVQVDPSSSLAGFVRYSQANVGGSGKSYDVSYLQATRGGGPSVDLSYTDPFYRKSDTALTVSVFSRIVYRFQTGLFGTGTSLNGAGSYFERRNGGAIGLSRPVNDYVSAGANFRFENVKTENLGALIDQHATPNDPTDDTMSNNFIQQDGDVAVLTLGGTIDHRDNPNDPARGYWAKADVSPGYSNITRVGGAASGTNILGPNYFTKATIEYRTYFSPDRRRTLRELEAPRRVFALRARYGNVVGNLPFFEQFFAGGTDTVRGYDEDRFWGKQTFVANLEYRQPIQKSFYLIGFVDYGGAWGGYGGINDFAQSSSFKMHLGYGPGLSFGTPLGNIQVYLGFGEKGKSMTHFLIGKSF